MAWLLLLALSVLMAAPCYWAIHHFKKPPEHRDVALIASGAVFCVVFLWGATALALGPVH